jgi:predicted ATPase/transcriptional regulator with XRE-family HTH domain
MDAERNDTFGGMLKRLRGAAGLTQEELAMRADMTAKGLSALERGERRRPFPHTFRSLADALGLTEEERAALLAAMPPRRDEKPQADGGSASDLPTLDRPVLDSPQPGLPAPTTPLVGRERELEVVKDLLSRPGTRLLTLTGVGGMGKTRLALEAARLAGGFPDGAAFVALAPLSDATLVVPTISRSLGLQEATGLPPLDAVREHLRGKKMLLVLDNFEHVTGASSEVSFLLESCPDLTVLVTSRAPLRIRSEQEYPVPPLGLPASTVSPDPDEVLSSPSGRLFVDRARAASPAFEVTAENAGAVAAICWRLDGLPLALELAAARARFLDPASLLLRLDRALSGGWVRDLPERQRTIQAALDWSYDLLSEEEKALFRRLPLFSGGFTMEAAEVVGAADGLEAEDVLDLLGLLVEQSLVLAETPAGRMRYRMLEPVRQYALEKLRESGEQDGVRLRHAGYYIELAEAAEPGIKGRDQVEWLDRLETENANLMAAISRSAEAGDPETAARIGWAIAMYWVMRARHSEGRRLMGQALARAADAPPGVRARIIWGLSVCIYGTGENERLMEVAGEGAMLARQAGDRRLEANTAGMMGFAALQLGDFYHATRILEESLAIFREMELDWDIAHILNHLAIPPMQRGQFERAADYAREALEITEATGDRLAGNIALYVLAQAALATGNRQEAARFFRRSLVLASELGDTVNSAYCMQALATVEEKREPHRTARLLGAAEALLDTVGVPLYATSDGELHRDTARLVREELGEEAWLTAQGEGREMTFEQAVAYALVAHGHP